MIADVTTADGVLRCDLSHAVDLSVPVFFDERSARAFSLPAAQRTPVRAGSFLGAVAQGGSVNCDLLEIYPHGNGTHTECVGHVVTDAVSVHDVAPRALLLARVVSVQTTTLGESGERYSGDSDPGDEVVTAAALRAAWPADTGEPALVLRTGAAHDTFNGTNPPYLTDDAADLLRERGVDHVLTDLPSLDREDDGGALAAHRAFFGLAPGATALPAEPLPPRTVTELCHVPDDCHDGRYLLSLGVAPLMSDAAPARPVLFPLEDG